MYDVIIVGARVAGAPTAMLLARRGLKVLVLDRATFPSDTLSTHQVQLPGWPGGACSTPSSRRARR
jgi:flavin-dependent dehydrogenase